MKANSCPFCGAERVYTLRGHNVRVKCTVCGSSGPEEKDKETAVEKWNERAGTFAVIEGDPEAIETFSRHVLRAFGEVAVNAVTNELERATAVGSYMEQVTGTPTDPFREHLIREQVTGLVLHILRKTDPGSVKNES